VISILELSASHWHAVNTKETTSFQSSSSKVSSFEYFVIRRARHIAFDFGCLGGYMKSMCESQITHPFVESILSWIGTDGQCLAALHFHISTLKPDQADSTLLGEKHS